jgi:hypothetical protein
MTVEAQQRSAAVWDIGVRDAAERNLALAQAEVDDAKRGLARSLRVTDDGGRLELCDLEPSEAALELGHALEGLKVAQEVALICGVESADATCALQAGEDQCALADRWLYRRDQRTERRSQPRQTAVAVRMQVHRARPRERRSRRARSPSSSSSRGDPSDSGDGESDPPVGGPLNAARRWVA